MSQLRFSVLLPLLAGVACGYQTTATANRVPMPVIVGPVEQIGGPSNAPDEAGATFDSKIDRTFTASSSSTTYGNVTVTTTTTSHTRAGAGKVDADVRVAAGGMNDRLIRVDQLRINAYSGFFYSAAWISSRVRVRGHVGRRIPSMRRGVPDPEPEVAQTEAPEAWDVEAPETPEVEASEAPEVEAPEAGAPEAPVTNVEAPSVSPDPAPPPPPEPTAPRLDPNTVRNPFSQ